MALFLPPRSSPLPLSSVADIVSVSLIILIYQEKILSRLKQTTTRVLKLSQVLREFHILLVLPMLLLL